MNRTLEHKGHRIGVTAIVIATLLLISSMIVLWSWNTLAVDLFQASVIKYKHALAAELLVATVSITLGLAFRLSSTRSHLLSA